jgi:hypothetical protein
MRVYAITDLKLILPLLFLANEPMAEFGRDDHTFRNLF